MRRFLSFAFLALGMASVFADDFRQLVEADWFLQEELRYAPQRDGAATPESDAAGGCDGVKNGNYGFHTNGQENPWWQVDLGVSGPVSRVVVWNRCLGAPERANRFELLVSEDGADWKKVYSQRGKDFHGVVGGPPARVDLDKVTGRYVRVQLPGSEFLHLDEVEVFGSSLDVNLALHKPATQSGVSQWSVRHDPLTPTDWKKRIGAIASQARALAVELRGLGVSFEAPEPALDTIEASLAGLDTEETLKQAYLQTRWINRGLLLSHPLLDFDTMLFAKRVPGTFNHMSDQYYGWWSQPGGGLYLMTGFRESAPQVTCISEAFTEEGSFLLPTLSYDAKTILFSWCKFHPGLTDLQDKFHKENVPADAFYHLFEMNVDGSGLRQLTFGKYDDFDGKYLPDGRIVFLSTRRGQSLQAGRDTAEATLTKEDLPDCYVRCGGGPERPVAVYTLHTMDADGTNLCAISPFEMFEWTPCVARDGSLLYSRWDYIDRNNMPYMGLWGINPDGTNNRIVYKNFTPAPHCTFEPRCVPDSNKIVFTASAHHAQTMGSLVLLDPDAGSEGATPIKRLTPEVVFPEIEGSPQAQFANPWPLSERFHLVTWGKVPLLSWPTRMPKNVMGLYLFDADGGMELLYRDPEISCQWPLPLKAQEKPPALAPLMASSNTDEGVYLITNIYRGLKDVAPGTIKSLRIVAVPAKTHPTMNFPNMGIMRDDPGKCVLGTVPVEDDGSAYFRVPAGVTMFFQALDKDGVAVQTMRSATHVQPGQTLSCVGCHEPRLSTPEARRMAAVLREPSKVTLGPEGAWPFRFDKLVQPVLDAKCVSCHRPGADDDKARRFNLTDEKAYETLIAYGKPSLTDLVREGYYNGASAPGQGIAARSALLRKLDRPSGHEGVTLSSEERERFVMWMDVYAQKLGAFDDAQEAALTALKAKCAGMLLAYPADAAGRVARAE